jgi:hypothetical protein
MNNLADKSGVSMQKLVSYTRLRASAVVFSVFDGFSTEIINLLIFLKRRNPDCMFVWMLKGDVVVNDKVRNLIHRLDIYLNKLQLRTDDHLDTLFGRLEEITKVKRLLNNQGTNVGDIFIGRSPRPKILTTRCEIWIYRLAYQKTHLLHL